MYTSPYLSWTLSDLIYTALFIKELMDSIRLMDDKCNILLEEDVSTKDAEQIAEFIDERVHALQYKVDHCRRYCLQY